MAPSAAASSCLLEFPSSGAVSLMVCVTVDDIPGKKHPLVTDNVGPLAQLIGAAIGGPLSRLSHLLWTIDERPCALAKHAAVYTKVLVVSTRNTPDPTSMRTATLLR